MGTSGALPIRRCRLTDVGHVSAFLRLAWHAAYDGILGVAEAQRVGYAVYSRFRIAHVIGISLIHRRNLTVLVAESDGQIIGHAVAQSDVAGDVILWMLYVHPNHKGRGVGTTLLQRIAASHPTAKSMRLEVLKANNPAIMFYFRRGFRTTGEQPVASLTRGVPSYFMEWQFERQPPLP